MRKNDLITNDNLKIKKYKKINVSNIAQFFAVIVLIILLLSQIYPIWLLIIKSFKSPTQDIYFPFSITFPFNYMNYVLAWEYVKFLFTNTLILAIANTVGTITVTSVAAYSFTRFKFPFKETIFMSILAIMMIPGVLTLVAMYIMIDEMALLGTRWAVILPQIAGNIPFNLLLFRTFFSGLSSELFESAKMDGANEFRIFISFMIPLSKAILATAAIMLFMQSWSDIIWPMLVLAESQLTISTGLIPFTDQYEKMTGGYGAPMAGYVLTSIPLVLIFFFASKQFIDGLTSGALKM